MKKILIAVSLCMAVCLFAGCGKTNEKLDEANKQIEELSGKINTLVELMNDYEDYEDEVHEIYDTSAVAEAYKSGDKDGLSEEDAYILKQATKVIKEIINTDKGADLGISQLYIVSTLTHKPYKGIFLSHIRR